MTPGMVMERERQALLGEYLFQPKIGLQSAPYCAVSGFEPLLRTPYELRNLHPVRVEPLEAGEPNRAFVQICPSLDYRFLWAHVDNDAYRRDYTIFLRRHHGMKLQELPRDVHVDHLFNRARARHMGLLFIRMALVPRSINTSHGAGYEKARTQGGIGRHGRERGIDEITLMKLLGVPTPRKGMPLTAQMQMHVQRIAVLFHLPPHEVERNIRELMEVASFRPAG